MTSRGQWSSLWRACPPPGDCVANASGARSSDLQPIEIVSLAQTVTHAKGSKKGKSFIDSQALRMECRMNSANDTIAVARVVRRG